MGIINSIQRADSQVTLNETLTIGVVVDAYDPQEMGRIRVQCPAWGDLDDKPIVDIPFARFVSPFAGQLNYMQRGPENAATAGAVSYGWWAIPKVGSQVIVACVDGNPEERVWLGCVYGQFMTHTLPHGRYLPDGPLASNEAPIEPLYSNQTTTFSRNGGRSSNEWASRGFDAQVAAISNEVVNETLSARSDLEGQGYNTSQIDERLGIDSQVHSITTPGFHAVSMDDRNANCRIRIRTTKGHQVIFDDTNERIYINTAKGNNWIELDENGNIDVYSSRRVSVHAEKDINFTAGGAFRVHANGVHLYSSSEARIHSKQDTSIKSDATIRMYSGNNTLVESTNNLVLKSNVSFFVQATESCNIKAGTSLHLTSTTSAHMLSIADDVFIKGTVLHTQGAPAVPAQDAISSGATEAFWTNRVPEHEGWARVMKIDTDGSAENEHTDQFEYDNENVGRKEFDDEFLRNANWRR